MVILDWTSPLSKPVSNGHLYIPCNRLDLSSVFEVEIDPEESEDFPVTRQGTFIAWYYGTTLLKYNAGNQIVWKCMIANHMIELSFKTKFYKSIWVTIIHSYYVGMTVYLCWNLHKKNFNACSQHKLDSANTECPPKKWNGGFLLLCNPQVSHVWASSDKISSFWKE